MQRWIILDKRDVSHEVVRGGTQCWGIREDVANVYPSGFSCFRIVQTKENSAMTHNLSITGFEVFGKPANVELWIM